MQLDDPAPPPSIEAITTIAKELSRVEAVPPIPYERSDLFRLPASTERSFDPRFVRNILRPIGLQLCGLFGFQTAQPLKDDEPDGAWVASNLDNQVEHLTQLLKWRMDQKNTPNAMQALEEAGWICCSRCHGQYGFEF